MKTRSAKAKGRRLQSLVAATILSNFPELTDKDVRSAQMGGSGIDIQLSEAARRVFPFAVEAKNHEKLNVWQTIKQAEENAIKEKLVPALVVSRNRMPEPYVAIPMSVWFMLVKRCGILLSDVKEFLECPTSTQESESNEFDSTRTSKN